MKKSSRSRFGPEAFLHAVTLATACSASALCSEKPVSFTAATVRVYFRSGGSAVAIILMRRNTSRLHSTVYTTQCSARPARVQSSRVKQIEDLLAGTCLLPGSAMAEQGKGLGASGPEQQTAGNLGDFRQSAERSVAGNANLGLAALSVAFLFGILGLPATQRRLADAGDFCLLELSRFAFFAMRAKTAAEEACILASPSRASSQLLAGGKAGKAATRASQLCRGKISGRFMLSLISLPPCPSQPACLGFFSLAEASCRRSEAALSAAFGRSRNVNRPVGPSVTSDNLVSNEASC